MIPHRLLPDGAPPPLAIVGTTASGKSSLAMALARVREDVELVSVDSMQVYRGMDIGTAKPTAAQQAEVRHHVIDVVDPWEPFDVHSFQRAVADALRDIAERDRKAVLVGGTGLYLQAVIDGFEIPGQFSEVAAELETDEDTEALHTRLVELDPLAASRMEPSNRRRIVRALEVTLGSGRPFSSYGPGVGVRPPTPICQIGIRLPQPAVGERIAARYAKQMESGFLSEVEHLADGPPLSRTAAQALGYRELLRYVGAQRAQEQEPTLEDVIDEAIRRTRAFARRQRAWFRRDERIIWFDAEVDPADCTQGVLDVAEAYWR